MKRILLVIAAMSVFLGGCSDNEAPKMKQAEEKAAQPSPATTMAPPAAEPMTQEPTASGEATGESMAAPETSTAPAETTAAAGGETASGMTEGEPAVGMTTAEGNGDKGKQIYDSVCFACHAVGVAGAPKLGDKTLWAPRIAQGMDTLVSHAINGFQGSSGVMPPKGGRTDLSDEDISAAVAYMVDQSK